MEPAWLDWARRLSALAQTGLTFTENAYDIKRYMMIRRIAAEMIAHGAGADAEQILDLLSSDAGSRPSRSESARHCPRFSRKWDGPGIGTGFPTCCGVRFTCCLPGIG
jgi:hypothetical protein